MLGAGGRAEIFGAGGESWSDASVEAGSAGGKLILGLGRKEDTTGLVLENTCSARFREFSRIEVGVG